MRCYIGTRRPEHETGEPTSSMGTHHDQLAAGGRVYEHLPGDAAHHHRVDFDIRMTCGRFPYQGIKLNTFALLGFVEIPARGWHESTRSDDGCDRPGVDHG